MDVGRLDIVVQQVFRQFFCHTLGQCSNQYTLLALNALLYLVHQVVNLVLRRTHLNLWVKESGRTNHLFYNNTLGLLQLIVGRCGRNIDHLWRHLLELVEGQRTVVEGGRQTESVLHEVGLASTVATIHSTDLGHRDVALVNHQQEVIGEEVE